MRTWFVDAFTTVPFAGNPAAVCLLDRDISSRVLQQIAREIGFSETAFIAPRDADMIDIRFFSPKQEIALCGHATLAAAHVLFESGSNDALTFLTRAGVAVPVTRGGDDNAGALTMVLPVRSAHRVDPSHDIPPLLLEALGVQLVVDARLNHMDRMLLLELVDAETVAGLRPDFARLVRSTNTLSGVVVTAPSIRGTADFEYRYFWPWSGTNEDPVTGAVHTFLTPYWAEKLQRSRLNAFQSSARTGMLTTELCDNMVRVSGHSVTIFEGQLAKLPI